MSDDREDRKAVVSVRFSPEEIDRLRSAADREGVPLSVVVRRAVTSPPRWSAPQAITASNSGTSVYGYYSGWAGSVTSVDGPPNTGGVVIFNGNALVTPSGRAQPVTD